MTNPLFAGPQAGTAIVMRVMRAMRADGKLDVPNDPIIPFIEGDGTGRDIWRASVRILDTAVEKAYGGKRKIAWWEVYASEKSFERFKATLGEANAWLPDASVEGFRKYLVGIKGPLTTRVGGGIRSLNVALRQLWDRCVCLRPVRWFKGVPSPVKDDYRSDALAAQVGGIGIAQGGNINYVTGHAVFETTHGTATKYADKDVVNPGSVTLSREIMLRHRGWLEAADLVIKGLDGAIGAKTATYAFHRQMDGAKLVKCSEFAGEVIKHMR